VVLVDVASTDGTPDRVAASPAAARLPLRLIRLARNGGGAEGFHHGVAAALRGAAAWLWLMDDDCEPAPDALERLLASGPAREPGTAAVLPVLRSPAGAPLAMHRGHIRRRWFLAPYAMLREPVPPAPVEVTVGTFVGPLIRADAARRAGLPLRQAFIRLEDVEYLTRVGRAGAMWLVPDAVVVHKEPAAEAITDPGLRARLADFTARRPFAGEWKRLYGLRNLIQFGRRGGYVSATQALSYVAVHVVRSLLFSERPLRTARLAVLYGADGWRGRFRNVPPDRWAALAADPHPARFLAREGLRYDSDA
jgi:GT2 family glycosyltransferase